MHEMALTQSVLDILQDAACSRGFTRVSKVWLEIGMLSGVEPEAMHFCFDVITKNTLAEGAVLEIIRTPGTGKCTQCGHSVEIAVRFDPCPFCGGYSIQVTGGGEMQVKNLEVS
jgi:hydrogenase nickel incorporation protein HypA/HybF